MPDSLATGRTIRTRVEVVARLGAGGTTVLACLRAEGQLAVRRTGPWTVHLVSVAAGPLGGDDVLVDVRVQAGARLRLCSAAAAVVLPGLHEPASATLLAAEVADGARLEIALEPTVVTGRARLAATTRARLSGGGRLRLVEQVLLGRHGEPPGEWTGRTTVDVDDRPVLRHTVRSGTLLLDGARAYRSELLLEPGAEPEPAAAGGPWVAMPLAGGGRLTTAWGADLSSAQRSPSRSASSVYPTKATVSSTV